MTSKACSEMAHGGLVSAGRTGMSTGDVWVCQTIRGAQGARVGKFPHLNITQTSPLPNIFTGFNKCLACRFPGYLPNSHTLAGLALQDSAGTCTPSCLWTRTQRVRNVNACDRVGAFRGASTKGELQSSEGAASAGYSTWAGPDTFSAVPHSPCDLLREVLLASLFQLSNSSRDTHVSEWKSGEPGSADVMKYF